MHVFIVRGYQDTVCQILLEWQTPIFRPFYWSTYISRQPQLRIAEFCWSKVLLSAWPCWWQLVHLDYGLGRRCWSSPRWCYLHRLCTIFSRLI